MYNGSNANILVWGVHFNMINVKEQCKRCFYFQVCANVLKQQLFIREIMLKEEKPKCEHYIPVADVVEVTHGKWKAGHYEGGILDGTDFEECSVCQFQRLFEDVTFKTTYSYCPNCGAKMDIEKE